MPKNSARGLTRNQVWWLSPVRRIDPNPRWHSPPVQSPTSPPFTLLTPPPTIMRIKSSMFSHKRGGTVHKTLRWLGCGFALSGPSTSVELCGKPPESCCPPCRYITHHGVGLWCHSHNRECRVPHRNQRRPNPVQQLLKHEREKEDREECKSLGATAGIVCVCAVIYVCVRVHVRVHAGYITSWQRIGGLMCFSFALWTSRPVREEPRQMLCDAHQHSFRHTLTPIHTHSHTHIYTHIQRKLQHLVAKSMSINLFILPSNWHIDWWWRA